jgi:hypothetical protein
MAPLPALEVFARVLATNGRHFGPECQVRLETATDGRRAGAGMADVPAHNRCRGQQDKNQGGRQ